MSVDMGLQALARGETREALDLWTRLVEAGTRDPEPYLFAAQLLYLLGETASYPQAIRFADRACELDRHSPEAWLLAGEWHLTMGLTEGQRRVAGSKRLFRLEEALRELGTFERVLECFSAAAALDDGRLSRIFARVAGMWHSRSVAERILSSAGATADQSTGPRPLDILGRSGARLEPTPEHSRLVERIREVRSRDAFVLLVVPPSRFDDYEEVLRESGLEPEAFVVARSEQWMEEQLPTLFRRGLALVGAPAVAYNEVAWFRQGGSRPIHIWWLGVELLTLGECLGGLARTSPGRDAPSRVERAWYAGRLVLGGAGGALPAAPGVSNPQRSTGIRPLVKISLESRPEPEAQLREDERQCEVCGGRLGADEGTTIPGDALQTAQLRLSAPLTIVSPSGPCRICSACSRRLGRTSRR